MGLRVSLSLEVLDDSVGVSQDAAGLSSPMVGRVVTRGAFRGCTCVDATPWKRSSIESPNLYAGKYVCTLRDEAGRRIKGILLGPQDIRVTRVALMR